MVVLKATVDPKEPRSLPLLPGTPRKPYGNAYNLATSHANSTTSSNYQPSGKDLSVHVIVFPK